MPIDEQRPSAAANRYTDDGPAQIEPAHAGGSWIFFDRRAHTWCTRRLL